VKQLCWQLGRIEIAGDIFSAMVNRHLDGEEVVARASFAHYDNMGTVRALISTIGEILAS
jgi:hypothetical protein